MYEERLPRPKGLKRDVNISNPSYSKDECVEGKEVPIASMYARVHTTLFIDEYVTLLVVFHRCTAIKSE